MAHVCDMRAITERAGKQLGLITTDQLRALGVGRQTERTLVARGALERLGHRVHRLAGNSSSFSQRLLVATLEAGDGAVVSHLAACALWRLDGVRCSDVEISVPRTRRPRAVPAVVHRVRDLVPVDVARRGPIPVTTPSRSLIDAAPRLSAEQIRDVVEHAAAGPSHLAALPAMAGRRTPPPGTAGGLEGPRRRAQATASGGGGDLAGDQDPPPDRRRRTAATSAAGPTRSQRREGSHRFRVRRSAGLLVEVDGHGTHSTRQERRSDAERDVRLTIERWRVARFTREDVDRPRSTTSRMPASSIALHQVTAN